MMYLCVLVTIFIIVNFANALLSDICHQVVSDSSQNPIMTWYTKIADLANNDNMKYLILERAPKTSSARTYETIKVNEEDLFPNQETSGFQLELSLWYKTWNISGIRRGLDGPKWSFFEGGGMLYSEVDESTSVYIYPDGETSLVGKWTDGKMADAKEDSVKNVRSQIHSYI